MAKIVLEASDAPGCHKSISKFLRGIFESQVFFAADRLMCRNVMRGETLENSKRFKVTRLKWLIDLS